jgi:hypothetical protein
MPPTSSCATGAETARPAPLADCSTETAMPRRVANSREISGTKTTMPTKLAPRVITTP